MSRLSTAMEIADMETSIHYHLEVHFYQTWNAIGEDLQNELLAAALQHLRTVCNYSNTHQRMLKVVLRICFYCIPEREKPAWELLHQFITDGNLKISGRNNAALVVFGLIGELLGRPLYQELVNDCIYMLLKNMTTEVLLDQVSLNICYYEHLDFNSAVKQPGLGLFAILGLYMPVLWPICCRQLQRLMDEEGGLLKSIKLLIGFFDFRSSEGFQPENTRECDELMMNIISRAGEDMDWSMSLYVNSIRKAYIPYAGDERCHEG